jgi:hypothetical protein
MDALTQHVLDLAAHGQDNENQPVNDQNRPEDGQVENLAPRTQETKDDSASSGVPKLELGKAAHEGLELVGRLCGEVTTTALLHILGGLKTRVELGRNECEEEVQEVDAKGVCDCERKVLGRLLLEYGA